MRAEKSMSVLLTYPQAVVAGPGEVGGKAWNLARLGRWGFPTPRGIAVSASVYDDVVCKPEVTALISKAAAIASHNVAEPGAQAALAQWIWRPGSDYRPPIKKRSSTILPFRTV